MDVKLLIDVGSTFTKVAAVDITNEVIVATAKSPTTVQEDITIGIKHAIRKIEETIGDVSGSEITACSSAAGGLRLVSIGLIPELSSEAAKRAALGAGAKIVGHYFYELSRREIKKIEETRPDIILLAGGTDGGNEKAIIHNAGLLAAAHLDVPIVVAGNKCAYDRLDDIFENSGKKVHFVDNVMPEIGQLEVHACRETIREVFMGNIVKAKGLDKARALIGDIIMPTPVAVLDAAVLLSTGARGEDGIGETIVIDVGGATTDVYSIAKGVRKGGSYLLRGLPEPFSKRTVEGDLGVRHNIDTLLEICKNEGIPIDEEVLSRFRQDAGRLPQNAAETAVDTELTRVAVRVSFERHVGRLETTYGPQGETLIQIGKDLSEVRNIIGTGGPITNSSRPKDILNAVLADPARPSMLLKPKEGDFYIDENYIMYAMGLLARTEPKCALRMMKRYLKRIL